MTDRHDHPFRAFALAVLLAPLYFYRWVGQEDVQDGEQQQPS